GIEGVEIVDGCLRAAIDDVNQGRHASSRRVDNIGDLICVQVAHGSMNFAGKTWKWSYYRKRLAGVRRKWGRWQGNPCQGHDAGGALDADERWIGPGFRASRCGHQEKADGGPDANRVVFRKL